MSDRTQRPALPPSLPLRSGRFLMTRRPSSPVSGIRRSLMIRSSSLFSDFRDAALTDDSCASLRRFPGRDGAGARLVLCGNSAGRWAATRRREARRPGEPIKMERRGRQAKTPSTQTHQSPVSSKKERRPSMFEKESVSEDRRPKTAFPPFR